MLARRRSISHELLEMYEIRVSHVSRRNGEVTP